MGSVLSSILCICSLQFIWYSINLLLILKISVLMSLLLLCPKVHILPLVLKMSFQQLQFSSCLIIITIIILLLLLLLLYYYLYIYIYIYIILLYGLCIYEFSVGRFLRTTSQYTDGTKILKKFQPCWQVRKGRKTYEEITHNLHRMGGQWNNRKVSIVLIEF